MVALLLVWLCPAGAAHDASLDSVLRVLDKAIVQTADYERRALDDIAAHTETLKSSRTPEQRYAALMECYGDYRTFCNDSALNCLQRARQAARDMQRADLVAHCNMLLGHQYVVSGYFGEAEHYLGSVDTHVLPAADVPTYYYYMSHLHRELVQYGADDELRNRHRAQAVAYVDSVNATMRTDDPLFYQRRCICLFFEERYDEALRINDQWREAAHPDTRSYANMAFYRSELCRVAGDVGQQKYWLAVSAINEIHSAVMHQTALWHLAEILHREGDTRRAFRYIECSWRGISYFSPHKRSWNVTPILTAISEDYRDKIRTEGRRTMMALCAIVLLVAGLVVALLVMMRERRVAVAARGELKRANEELEQLNARLATVNAHLSDSNRVKDQYITDFFHICAGYIEKLDNYRLRINRKLKANQLKDVIAMTNSDQLRQDEQKLLLRHFDEVFLHLFPNFVDDFNALLAPEARIATRDAHSLTTPLRIFALIRLGISESSSIAEFLNYSPNSIYSYRTRVKNGALGSRTDFENRVRTIGL